MKKIYFIFLILVILCAVNLFSSERPAFTRDYRPLGIGSAFTGISDDHNAIFYNPAGLAFIEKNIVTVFDFRFTIADDLLKFYDFYDKNKTKLEKYDLQTPEVKTQLMQDILKTVTKYKVKFVMDGPLNLNFISANKNLKWGISANEYVDVGVKLNFDIIPNADVWGGGNLVLAMPFAYRVLNNLSVGANIKYIYRAGIEEYGMNMLSFAGYDPKIQPGTGIGFDIGTMYKLDNALSIGLSARDFMDTKISYDEVKDGTTTVKEAKTGTILQRMNLGVGYNLTNGILKDKGLPEMIAAIDIWDITNAEGNSSLFDSTFWAKLHMGLETRFRFASVSVGLNSGYPTIGLGFSFGFFKLNYVYYTDELGLYAGDIPESKHMLSIAFRWGTGVKKAAESAEE